LQTDDGDVFWKVARKELVLSLMDNSKQKKVLEVGCGTGYMSADIAKNGHSVIATDVSDELIEVARQNNGEMDIKFEVLDITKNVLNERFDYVIALDVLEHIEDDSTALGNMGKMLCDGGKLILTVPTAPRLYGPMDELWGHYRRYSKERLVKILKENGFEIDMLRYWNLGMIPFVFFGATIFRMRYYPRIRKGAHKRIISGLVNRLITQYYLKFENEIDPKNGMTLVCRARKV